MTEKLTYREFELVLKMMEAEQHRMYGFFMEDHHHMEGAALVDRGILLEGPLNMIIPDRWGDDMDSKEVDWNPETRTYQYWTSFGGGWVDAPEQDMKTYDLNMNWTFSHLSELIGIGEDVIVREIVPNLLWELGSIWSGRRKATVFLSRNLSYSKDFDRVHDGLAKWSGKAAGVVLSLAVPASRHDQLPGGHQILSLKNAIVETPTGYKMDIDLLNGALKGGRQALDNEPIAYSADFSSVTINGRTFIFTGGKQRDVLEVLIRAWRFGEPKCRTGVVLEKVGSKAKSISQLFNHHPDWNDLIGYGGGFCWLKI